MRGWNSDIYLEIPVAPSGVKPAPSRLTYSATDELGSAVVVFKPLGHRAGFVDTLVARGLMCAKLTVWRPLVEDGTCYRINV